MAPSSQSVEPPQKPGRFRAIQLGMEDTISVMERAQILWIYFADLRKTTQLARSVLTMTNEWAKVLAAGALGFLAAYLTASKP
jgi:hypothetical protein